VSRDFTALVGVLFDANSQTYHVIYCRVWKPKSNLVRYGHPVIDLTDTIGNELIRLHRRHHVAAVIYDPYQLHSIAVDLEKLGVRMIEIPHTARRVESDQSLYDAILVRNIRHFNHEELNEHISNAVAIETPRGFRLSIEKVNRKIDAAVALTMALFGSSNSHQSNFFGEFLREAVNKISNPNTDEILARLDRAYGQQLTKDDDRNDTLSLGREGKLLWRRSTQYPKSPNT